MSSHRSSNDSNLRRIRVITGRCGRDRSARQEALMSSHHSSGDLCLRHDRTTHDDVTVTLLPRPVMQDIIVTSSHHRSGDSILRRVQIISGRCGHEPLETQGVVMSSHHCLGDLCPRHDLIKIGRCSRDLRLRLQPYTIHIQLWVYSIQYVSIGYILYNI